MQPTSRLAEFFSDTDFCLPLWEVALLILILSVCLLSGKHKTGLISAYLFVFYWSFIFNKAHIMDLLGNTNWGTYAYSIAGVLVVAVTIVSFFVEGDK
jgi:hypothetical protein